MTAAQIADRVNRAWPLWQEAQHALDRMSETMQAVANAVAEDAPAPEIPQERVREVHKAIAKFTEKFNLLVREQKRKVVR